MRSFFTSCTDFLSLAQLLLLYLIFLFRQFYIKSMFNLNSLLLSSEDPQALVDFYTKVLHTEPGWSGGDYTGFQLGSGGLVIGPHDKVLGKSTNPERMIFNLETDDVEGEFERIKNIEGVKVIAEPYHPTESPDDWLATFADPDNNYFQIATPMKF